jgi:uncharacterized protein (DUF2384 family)
MPTNTDTHFTLYEQLHAAAWRAFRDRSRAEVWLRCASPSLEGRRPIDACVNQAGYLRCCRVLDRIAAEMRKK